MKFSFINASPNETLSKREKCKSIASWPPLGLLYLATTLRERGVEVSVLDQPAKGYTVNETLGWIERENPDILGFSAFATSGRMAVCICDQVKRWNPDITTVFGNYYATFNADRIIRKIPSVDVVVRGEGEYTVVDLVDHMEKGGDLGDILGITFRNGDDAVSTPDRPLIEDLDSLPFPDRRLLDVEYHSTIAGVNIAVKKFTSVISSRGCVYSCRFCSCHKFARGIWRPRSVENTMGEFHYLASEGFKQFIFVDDSLTLNPKRVIELCRRMRKEKIDMEWFCEGRVDSCSDEMLGEMVKANCKIIFFGIESANQRILDYYKKHITPQQSRRAVEKARKAGIDVIVGSFIVGAADETREEIWNTLEFAKELPIDIPQINILGIHVGMDIWDEMRSKGFLDEEENWDRPIEASRVSPSAVPVEEIMKMIHEAYSEFMQRPGFILRQMARTLSSRYRIGVVINNLSRIGEIRDSIHNII
jgi:anaerobic magnesium-protoporphyrin IX monomethyl ester cyclase